MKPFGNRRHKLPSSANTCDAGGVCLHARLLRRCDFLHHRLQAKLKNSPPPTFVALCHWTYEKGPVQVSTIHSLLTSAAQANRDPEKGKLLILPGQVWGC